MGRGGMENFKDPCARGVSRPWSVPWYTRLISVLILVGALAYLTDVLAVTTHKSVGKKDAGWLWGATKAASGGPAASGFQPTSLHLLIKVSGDELTAEYQVIASPAAAVSGQMLAAEYAESGDEIVSDLLGQISIAQFRDGITGRRYEWNTLNFGAPQLQVTKNKLTATISSSPFRLMLDRQFIRIAPSAGSARSVSGGLQFTDSPGIQLVGITGARLTSADGGDTVLLRGGSTMTAVLREPKRNWTTGLRAIGGVTLPVVGGALQRLGSIVAYLVLLWALSKVSKDLAQTRPELRATVAVSRNAVGAIVGALGALSVLEFCYQLVFGLHPQRALLAPELAGPVGLMVAGAVVLWPVFCWRVTPAECQDEPTADSSSRRRWPARLAMPTIALGYLVVLYAWLGVRTYWLVVPATAGIVVLVYLLGHAVLPPRDGRGAAPWPVLAGLLAVILGASVAWPVLVYSGFRFRAYPSLVFVNVIGKWTYVVCAAVTLAGLCVIAARVIRILARSHVRLVSLLVIVVILAATGPALIHQSGIRDPHAGGLLPPDLVFYSGLYRALPQLLGWLLLALAIAVVLSITRADRWDSLSDDERAGDRIATRRMAIAIMMLILFSAYSFYYHPWVFSNYTWLYLPVTPITGVLILAWLVLPSGLATAGQTLPTGQAIRCTLDAWRNADFTDRQRQQIMGNGDDLRKAALEDNPAAYEKTFASLTAVQNHLADQHDVYQRRAHEYLTEAFDHTSEVPDSCTARLGALTGALLGVVPAVVLLLATRPASGWSGYPVLDFLGFTGWALFIWPTLGWAIGYFLPFIRGGNGINKALWVYASAGASLPMNLLWLDGRDWSTAVIYYLELFAFLLILSVILCDLVALRSAGLPALAWIQVHNWRFLITWSTAVIAAIGTAAVTFLSTAATDLGHQASSVFAGQGTQSSGAPAKPGK